MNASWHRHGRFLAALLAAAWAAGGCVSSRYKLAAKTPGPSAPPALELTAGDPAVRATLHTVIVYHGPGSWKKEAYWDEYVVSVAAGPAGPLTLESVVLWDGAGTGTEPGRRPWDIERTSRERLKVARRTGQKIALGAGVAAAWFGSAALAFSHITIWGGVTNTTAVAAGGAGMLGIPLVLLGSGVRTAVARHEITGEFERRRLALPLSLAGGATRTGSLFFPVTPDPARLELKMRDGSGRRFDLSIDLGPLAGLHLAEPAAQRYGDKPTTVPTTAP